GRHQDVENDCIRGIGEGEFDSTLTVLGLDNANAFQLKAHADKQANRLLIVGNEHAAWRVSPAAARGLVHPLPPSTPRALRTYRPVLGRATAVLLSGAHS